MCQHTYSWQNYVFITMKRSSFFSPAPQPCFSITTREPSQHLSLETLVCFPDAFYNLYVLDRLSLSI